MEKPADTQNPIHDLLKCRWSPRAFDERAVEANKLRSLFEAARWAPSSNNEQPWRFLVATKENKTEWDRLFHCLVEGNQRWANLAPVLMLSVGKMTFDDGSPNRHAFHDVGLAAENLMLQATALGLGCHQMAGFHVDKAREDLGVPDGYEPARGRRLAGCRAYGANAERSATTTGHGAAVGVQASGSPVQRRSGKLS